MPPKFIADAKLKKNTCEARILAMQNAFGSEPNRPTQRRGMNVAKLFLILLLGGFALFFGVRDFRQLFSRCGPMGFSAKKGGLA